MLFDVETVIDPEAARKSNSDFIKGSPQQKNNATKKQAQESKKSDRKYESDSYGRLSRQSDWHSQVEIEKNESKRLANGRIVRGMFI